MGLKSRCLKKLNFGSPLLPPLNLKGGIILLWSSSGSLEHLQALSQSRTAARPPRIYSTVPLTAGARHVSYKIAMGPRTHDDFAEHDGSYSRASACVRGGGNADGGRSVVCLPPPLAPRVARESAAVKGLSRHKRGAGAS